MSAPPRIVTLTMDEASFARFNAERQRYFPPERNSIPAHITLFHALPGEQHAAMDAQLRNLTRAQTPFHLTTTELWMMGRGVAYRLESMEATRLRSTLRTAWLPWLTPQDAQGGWRPHITIQNKVTAEAAKTLHATLSAAFAPAITTAIGLDVWDYMGGPWSHVQHYPFAHAG